MEAPEIYHALPLHIDPASKSISSTDASLTTDLDDLNKLHRLLLTLETPNQVPPPPVPVNPKRSAQITKMKDSGNAAFKKGDFNSAIQMYTMAIRMASERPAWEPSGLIREELSALYNNRAQAYMQIQGWAEAMVDAEVSVECKRVGNVKAWFRRGQCLREMGRLEEAREWVKSGVEFERAGPEKQNIGELETLGRELDKAMEKA
ncbi:translocation protein [Teratosphaeria destructans]|uniref:Translocation protein n=1 Tax=Teratosphaeria destructans TaxID=418781 RepID=A0A9W7SYM2_9PEZI|nr:translocation protein [Teratosphaeria destructans]